MSLRKYFSGIKNQGEEYRNKLDNLQEILSEYDAPMVVIMNSAGLVSDCVRLMSGSGKRDGYSHSAWIVKENGEYKIGEAVHAPSEIFQGRSGYIKTKDFYEGLSRANKVIVRKVKDINTENSQEKVNKYVKEYEGNFNKFDSSNSLRYLGSQLFRHFTGDKDLFPQKYRSDKKSCTSLINDCLREEFSKDLRMDNEFLLPQTMAESDKLETVYEIDF